MEAPFTSDAERVFDLSSQLNALLDALYSTGSVTKLKMKIIANIAIPSQ